MSKTVFLWVVLMFVCWIVWWVLRKREDMRTLYPGMPSSHKKRSIASRNRRDKSKLVEYPSYELSSGAENMRLRVVAQHSQTQVPTLDNDSAMPEFLIEKYRYEDLKTMIVKRDVAFFERVAKAKQASFAAKLEIYTGLVRKSSEELAYLSNDGGPLSAYNEALAKQRKLSDMCESICEEIRNQKDQITAKGMYQDYREILWDKEYGFENLVGRTEVKDSFAEEVFGFVNDPSSTYTGFQNRLIVGPSGSGKTKLAACLAFATGRAGITVFDSYELLSKSDFESTFVGATTGKVDDLFVRTLERGAVGDELYQLPPQRGIGGASYSHGGDSINMIIYNTDRYKGLSRLYAIGYEEEMYRDFLPSNEGMSRRFPEKKRIILKDYTVKELAMILIRHLIYPGALPVGNISASTIYAAIEATHQVSPELFTLQASAVIEIAEHITTTIKTAKNLKWRSDDDSHNSQMFLICYNDFMQRHTYRVEFH